MSETNRDLNHLHVLIVGCGNIAGGFDQKRSSSDLPYTHSGAYVHDGRFKITVCVEPDDNRRTKYMADWDIPVGVRSIDEILDSSYQFDVISICSPTAFHAHHLEIAMRLKPKLIFCEKPVTASLAETEKLVNACRKANILLAVNYTRRWDPDINKLKADILTGQWGRLRSVVGYYNKGILNNGTHMLDLLNLLIGPMDIIKVGKPIYDFFPSDPTVPVWLEGAHDLPVHLVCGHADDYALFDLQLIFSHGVLTMEEGGMFWRKRRVSDSKMFKGYRTLEEDVRQPGEYPHAMLLAINNIYQAITTGESLSSNGESALAVQRICEQIKLQACKL